MNHTLETRPRPALERRLRPLYVTGFLQGFALWYAVEKLFMKTIGFNDALVTVATCIYIVVMMIANIPFGVLADRWSRKGVLHLATLALVTGTVICGLSHGFWTYVAGISVWGLFYACYAGTYDSIIYDVVLEETGAADEFERYYGRVQMYDSAAFIAGALASGLVAQFLSLRAEFFLTVPFTCCAFLALHRFREPTLHKAARPAPLAAHLGQLLRAVATRADVACIVVCVVCNAVAMRLIFEFCQLWWIGLRLPAGLFGPVFALVYCGSWAGGYLASRAKRPMGPLAALLTLVCSAGLLFKTTAIPAQVLTIIGIMLLTVILARYLHDAMPSHIRAGASSVVSTISYAVFIPVALGFGLVGRDHGIFEASWVVIAALAGVFVTLGLIVLRTAPTVVRDPVKQGSVSS
jgi:MFS family permease